jgi:murein DD-endopeptidase MepM/ murein hydrolase activator NlpD
MLRDCEANYAPYLEFLMKRNRLVQPSKHHALFSDTANYFSRYRYFALFLVLGIIVLSLTGFITSDDQQSTVVQSNVIDLPGLPAAEQVKTSLPISVVAPLINTSLPEFPTVVEAEIVAQEQMLMTPEVPNGIELDWEEITVKSGDNLSLIFPRVGLTARDVYNVTQLDKTDIKPLLNLKPGQTIHLGTLPEEEAKSLEALKIVLDPLNTFYISKFEEGYEAKMETRDVDVKQQHVTGEIENSLFLSGLTAGLSDKIIMEMAYIFGWDIDFALDLRKGDHFKLIYDEHYLDGKKIDDGEILAAEFTNRGKTFRAVRFIDSEGRGQYYSPEGHSMRKTFTRTPVPLSRISSRFNPNRKHPVLKTNRPHRGVDYAAKTGTPILATGDGKVAFKGRKGGYGRTVILSHGGKYTTLYAHMSRYKKGMRTGQRVRQGQTIGYIGSSGLATGPHLHYEFRVNGVHRNPLTVA